MIEAVLLLAFPLAMAFAAANDLFTMTIPNKISLVLIASFFVVAAISGLSTEQILMHVAVGAAALIIGFLLFAFRFVGGGDAKLMAAGALWMGTDLVIEYIAYITIFGGVLSLLILAYRKLVPAEAMSLPPWAMRLHKHGGGIPYGIAIAAASLMLYPSTEWFRALSA